MVVGILQVELHIAQSFSLKDKRRVLQGTIERIRRRFNVSVAEIDHQDVWQRALLAIVTVSNQSAYTDRSLRSVLRYLESQRDLEVVECHTELI
ncbi:MAG: DUF503 domain-containing protein [Clostridia bacterium]|nr:DUF503 domain-containing protein [Clostridia bacterium]